MDQIVCDHLKLDAPAADMTEWSAMVDKVLNLKKTTKGQIENCMQVLLELDQSLKSQPTDDQILLETALCRLAMAGSGR